MRFILIISECYQNRVDIAIDCIRCLNADLYNFMNAEEYAKFKQDLQESQERAAKTLARISNTLVSVKETIHQIQQNEENIDNFKKAFGDVMQQLAVKIAGSMGSNPLKKREGQHYEHMPKQLPISQLADRINQQKSILFITGAGVSAPSGIPTFRGVGGLYSKKFTWEGKQYEPEEFITESFYNQHPQPIWQWIQDIYQLSITCKPNPIHLLIHKLALLLSSRGIKVTLVTQNVDDLHIKPQKKEYLYSAVHGNVKFVRCQNMHLTPYVDVRDRIIKQGSAKCSECKELVRPHVLFFDESYGPLYGEDVKSQKFPFVFIIGSSLSTGLCSRFAGEAEEKVEINPEPVIEVGRVYQYKKNSQEVLEQILKKLA